jgi:hypothetical protein
MSSRQIQKLEYWELNYNYDSFLIEKIFKKYNFSKKEKDAIILYSIWLEKISKL